MTTAGEYCMTADKYGCEFPLWCGEITTVFIWKQWVEARGESP
jgi:hypothetical protein